jgi:hypothetical protein
LLKINGRRPTAAPPLRSGYAPAIRSLLTFKLGAWVGITIAALFAKRALRSHGDPESDELDLVAVFDGVEVRSEASEFRGGSMLAWFGGISVDLRDAVLAEDAQLSVNTFMGGIAVKTPPTWRIEGDVKSLFGGIKVDTPTPADPDAPVLTVEGTALLGGIAIGSGAP